MDTLYSIQRSLFTVYNFLPIVSMITLLTFGFGLGNYGMITIFMGQFAVSILIFLLRIPYSSASGNAVKKTVFALFPTEPAVQFLSIWLANVSFLFAALIWNAWDVYNIDPMRNVGSDPNVIAQIDTPIFKSKVSNRKTRCKMIITTCAILAAILVGYRVLVVEGTHIGSLALSVIAIGAGVTAAFLWDKIVKQPNLGVNNMDIFGISQQLIAVTQTDIKTMCELKPATPASTGDVCAKNADCASAVCANGVCA